MRRKVIKSSLGFILDFLALVAMSIAYWIGRSRSSQPRSPKGMI